MAEENIQILMKSLRDKSQVTPLRLLTIEKIAEHSERALAVNAITEALLDDEQEIRSYAAEVLGRIEDKRALFPLIDALQDGYYEVRMAAIRSLAKIKDNQAVSAIAKRLNDENSKVRYEAVKALGEFDDVAVVTPLFRALTDATEAVKIEAGRVLLNLKLSDKLPDSIIEPFLEHPEKFCREIAVKFLTFRVFGDPLVLLIKGLKDESWEVRLAVLEELAKIAQRQKEKHSQIIDLCLECLDDENSKVKLEAIDILREVKAEKAIDSLIRLSTKDKDEKVKFEAIDALTEIRRTMRVN
ncbi:MAG: HEAT repeat domain-containing protein [Candidatus Heimdallarchaeaceae archaeon]